MQYHAPLGGERQGVIIKDISYDGKISQNDHTVSGGLGKLTDDIYGFHNLTELNASPWVGYDTNEPELTFEFVNKPLLKRVIIHVNNNGKDVKIFDSVQVLISSDNEKYVLKKTYKPNKEQISNIDAFAVIINIGRTATKYIRLKFTKQSVWLLISEVVFVSDGFPTNQVLPYPTKFIGQPFSVKSTTRFNFIPVEEKGIFFYFIILCNNSFSFY